MEAMLISKTTLRRLVMGCQGLWPGRRWIGAAGTAQALKAMEALQLDPLNVVARSQDIALWGRVLDYRPEFLDRVTYQERRFFDYGGSLFIYPMAELPYWRLHMERRALTPYRLDFVEQHQEALEQVLKAIHERGPLGNRDFAGNRRVNSYRGRKDTGVALFHWWLVGELMITRRQGFERIYDLRRARGAGRARLRRLGRRVRKSTLPENRWPSWGCSASGRGSPAWPIISSARSARRKAKPGSDDWWSKVWWRRWWWQARRIPGIR